MGNWRRRGGGGGKLQYQISPDKNVLSNFASLQSNICDWTPGPNLFYFGPLRRQSQEDLRAGSRNAGSGVEPGSRQQKTPIRAEFQQLPTARRPPSLSKPAPLDHVFSVEALASLPLAEPGSPHQPVGPLYRYQDSTGLLAQEGQPHTLIWHPFATALYFKTSNILLRCTGISVTTNPQVAKGMT